MTPTQQRVLEVMAHGGEIHTLTGLNFRVWLFGPTILHKAVLPSTLFALVKHGWVETKKEDWRGATFKITKKGRRALRAEGKRLSSP